MNKLYLDDNKKDVFDAAEWVSCTAEQPVKGSICEADRDSKSVSQHIETVKGQQSSSDDAWGHRRRRSSTEAEREQMLRWRMLMRTLKCVWPRTRARRRKVSTQQYQLIEKVREICTDMEIGHNMNFGDPKGLEELQKRHRTIIKENSNPTKPNKVPLRALQTIHKSIETGYLLNDGTPESLEKIQTAQILLEEQIINPKKPLTIPPDTLQIINKIKKLIPN